MVSDSVTYGHTWHWWSVASLEVENLSDNGMKCYTLVYGAKQSRSTKQCHAMLHSAVPHIRSHSSSNMTMGENIVPPTLLLVLRFLGLLFLLFTRTFGHPYRANTDLGIYMSLYCKGLSPPPSAIFLAHRNRQELLNILVFVASITYSIGFISP